MTVTTPIPDGLAPGGASAPAWARCCATRRSRSWSPSRWPSPRSGSPVSSGSGGSRAASPAASRLGLANHLATERWLLKTISSGEEVTRNRLAAATFVRLLILTAVAVGIAVLFWPDGIGLLLGLAIFRLIALVMTIIPLLRELKKDANTP